ncbi:MAG: XcyI family restriction endonuclease [Treponema sp.]|nr:XcyI family restriction endonuclease [Treponema sp.]
MHGILLFLNNSIVIREELGENRYRNIVAIEVKGGKDFSNIHNRVGEKVLGGVSFQKNTYNIPCR